MLRFLWAFLLSLSANYQSASNSASQFAITRVSMTDARIKFAFYHKP